MCANNGHAVPLLRGESRSWLSACSLLDETAVCPRRHASHLFACSFVLALGCGSGSTNDVVVEVDPCTRTSRTPTAEEANRLALDQVRRQATAPIDLSLHYAPRPESPALTVPPDTRIWGTLTLGDAVYVESTPRSPDVVARCVGYAEFPATVRLNTTDGVLVVDLAGRVVAAEPPEPWGLGAGNYVDSLPPGLGIPLNTDRPHLIGVSVDARWEAGELRGQISVDAWYTDTGSVDAPGGVKATFPAPTDDGSAGNPVGECVSYSDCPSGQFCSASSSFSISCFASASLPDGSVPCSLDSECATLGADYICGPTSTVSTTSFELCAGRTCVPGCSDTLACKAGEQCDTATHRCFVPPCGAASDCGVDSFCSAGVCTPKPCSAASDCVARCFKGGCYATLGTCMPQLQ
jgi:hypothetical protein